MKYKNRILTVCAIFLAAIGSYFIFYSASELVYYVALDEVPQDLKSDLSGYDRFESISFSIRPPFFRWENGNIKSPYLSDFSMDQNFRKIKLCPKRKQNFCGNVSLTNRTLLKSFENLNNANMLSVKIEKFYLPDDCLTVEFENSYPQVIDDLSKLSSAPFLIQNNMMCGVTPLKLSSKKSDFLAFEFNSKNLRKVKLIFARWSWFLKTKTVPDNINYLNSENREKVLELWPDKFSTQNYISPNMSYVFFNILEEDVRKNVTSCFNRKKFIKSLNPLLRGRTFNLESSFYPRSLLSHQKSQKSDFRNCKKSSHPKKLKVLNFYPLVDSELRNFFAKLSSLTGYHFDLISKDHSKINVQISEETKKYDVFFLGTSSHNWAEYVDLFASGNKRQRFMRYAPLGIADPFLKAKNMVPRGEEFIQLIEKIGLRIIDSSYAIPLYSITKKNYFKREGHLNLLLGSSGIFFESRTAD